MPADPQVAPDGTRIAYALSETDWDDGRITSHLYLVTTDPDFAPRQLTRGTEGEAAPHWSPDGKHLAFYTTRTEGDTDDTDLDPDDDPKQQVHLLPMDGFGGEAEPLTDAPEGVLAFDWLPDSSGIIYLAREPRRPPLQAAYDDKQDRKDDAVLERAERFRNQIWRIGREDKKPTLLHPGDYGIGELTVSPDGAHVAYTTNYTGEPNDYHLADIHLLTLETGETRPLTTGPGGKFHPLWTPGSDAVLYTMPLDPALSYSQENLYCVPIGGGPSAHITANFPHDITGWHGFWYDAQGILYVSAAVGTATAIFTYHNGTWTPRINEDGHIHDFHVAPNGSIAYVSSGMEDVPEVLWLAPNARTPLTLTDHNDDWADRYAVPPTELVRWPSDEWEIEALLTLPTDYDPDKRYPLIVNIHGGPHGRAVQALTPYGEAQVYAAQGYCVLQPNYRGSEGYGSAFCIANRGDLGGGDFRDIQAGIDWAIAEGIADPERLGIMGASYGGYLTNWAVGHTDRFQAAVSRFGIFSLATDFSNSIAPRWEVEYLDGFPWDKPADYVRLSPATYVQDIHTPMLLLHGDGDTNTFVSNSQEMYTALRLLGRTVQYAHYPREGHGFAEPQHRIDEFARCLSWFDRYLQGGGHPATYRIGDKLTQGDWELTVTHASLETYAGRGADKRKRYVEVAFVLRDTGEGERTLQVGAGDVMFSRLGATRGQKAAGLPISVLGEKVLAEGGGWRFVFTPPAGEGAKRERGLTVPLALAFRITDQGGTYTLTVKNFPPVTMDVPAADPDENKADKTPAKAQDASP